MLPVLVHIGPLTIRTYGVMVALGFFFALQYLLSRARKKGISENFVLDLGLYAIVAGLAGARLAYVLSNWSWYAAHPTDILKVWEGGLVYYGGFIAGTLAVLVFLRARREVKLLVLGDLIAPALALGHFFGRLGCFFAGCCYGIPAELPWSVTFCNSQALAPAGIARHPTQLYEAAGNLVLFVLLDRLSRRPHRDGAVLAAYLALYAVLRFCVEFYRGDERGAFVYGFSQGQAISVLLLIAAAFLAAFIYGKRTSLPHCGQQ